MEVYFKFKMLYFFIKLDQKLSITSQKFVGAQSFKMCRERVEPFPFMPIRDDEEFIDSDTLVSWFRDLPNAPMFWLSLAQFLRYTHDVPSVRTAVFETLKENHGIGIESITQNNGVAAFRFYMDFEVPVSINAKEEWMIRAEFSTAGAIRVLRQAMTTREE